MENDIKILYEDKYMLICEKPVGVLSEREESGGDIISLAEAHTGTACYPVHRLDRTTGGAIVIAKTAPAAARLGALIQERAFEKEYLAAISGCPDAPEGVYEDLLFRDARKNKSYVVKRSRRGVKAAKLEYRVIASSDAQGADFKSDTDSIISLVRIKLHTGRTHQIRVQFASRGMPLIGDRRYGGKAASCEAALWSHRIVFRHPFTGDEIEAISTPPKVFPWDMFEINNIRAVSLETKQ